MNFRRSKTKQNLSGNSIGVLGIGITVHIVASRRSCNTTFAERWVLYRRDGTKIKTKH
jgi:hypothetical protein